MIRQCQEAVDQPRKQSRPDVATRIARNKTVDFTEVVLKWNSLCKDEVIQNHIEQFVWNINKVALEAYHIVNMHILRCLTHSLTLPKFDKTSSISAVRCCRKARTAYIGAKYR